MVRRESRRHPPLGLRRSVALRPIMLAQRCHQEHDSDRRLQGKRGSLAQGRLSAVEQRLLATTARPVLAFRRHRLIVSASPESPETSESRRPTTSRLTKLVP